MELSKKDRPKKKSSEDETQKKLEELKTKLKKQKSILEKFLQIFYESDGKKINQ